MQSRMKLFVGSSSEAEKYAHVIQDLILEAGGPIVEVEGSWGQDEPGTSLIESLLDLEPSIHATLLLASANDNVFVEYGVCVKACGPERTALATLGPVAQPGELNGMNHIELFLADDLEEFRARNRLHVFNWLDTVLRLPRPTSERLSRRSQQRKPALRGRSQDAGPRKARPKKH